MPTSAQRHRKQGTEGLRERGRGRIPRPGNRAHRPKQTEGYRCQIQIWSDEVKVIPGHRKPQQLAEQKRHRLVVGQAKGQESGGKVGASMGIFLSIPRRRVGHLGAAGPERSPVPLGSAVRRAPRGLCIPMPAVYS